MEEERQRIAQQLHDTAGQILFKISMSAQELQQAPAAADPELVCKSAREIETDAAEASAYLREAMHNVATFSARTGIATEVVTLGTPARAKPEIETVLLSVVPEALHNIEKHAGANAVVVSVAYQAQEVVLAVEDDGNGLPADFKLNLVPGRRAGLGIPGLMQKVNGVAGTLRLGENDDGGTSVRVAVPVTAARP